MIYALLIIIIVLLGVLIFQVGEVKNVIYKFLEQTYKEELLEEKQITNQTYE